MAETFPPRHHICHIALSTVVAFAKSEDHRSANAIDARADTAIFLTAGDLRRPG